MIDSISGMLTSGGELFQGLSFLWGEINDILLRHQFRANTSSSSYTFDSSEINGLNTSTIDWLVVELIVPRDGLIPIAPL